MSPRLNNIMKHCSYILFIYAGHILVPAYGVQNPPNNPSTIEAQAKFFQDFFSVQLSPYKMEFGHVCEDPNTWQQRYEKKDFKTNRDMGKVRWGDKQGGYGEHYWDFNHAGPSDDHDGHEYGNGNYDDGSYHHDDDINNDHYDEPSSNSPNYETNEYDAEKSATQDDVGRAKRAHRIKHDRKSLNNKNANEQENPVIVVDDSEENQQENIDLEIKNKSIDLKRQRPRSTPKREPNDRIKYKENQNKHNERERQTQSNQNDKSHNTPKTIVNEAPKPYILYENGSGVRHHQQTESNAEVRPQHSALQGRSEYAGTSSGPRLFMNPNTGHIIDRITGQAYLLQPVIDNANGN